MSKVETLREKYKHLGKSTLDFFIESDKTSTKKYLDYMLKTWDNRGNYSYRATKQAIVDATVKFQQLLPYIDNKDIYSPIYNDFGKVVQTIQKSEEIKEDKTFIREEHVIVIKETDTYLMISPITFRGSCKYGANTKWCTASKSSEYNFNDYKKGFLVYVIDKTGKRRPNYEKIAFYSGNPFRFSDSYDVYNAQDYNVNESGLINGGWTTDELFELDICYRHFNKNVSEYRKVKADVNKVINTLKKLDLNQFKVNLGRLNQSFNLDVEDLNKTISSFNDQFKNFKTLSILDKTTKNDEDD